MFQKKILFNRCGKLLKYKFKNKSGAFHTLRSETPLHVNCRNTFISFPTEINGFHKAFLLNQKLFEIKNDKKFMSQNSDSKCWKCKQLLEMKNFVCTLCGALQYPKPQINFFELLNISQMYDINLDELIQNFRKMQMIFHPDKFSNKSKEELEISETYSRLLNKAFTTLKDPVARGFYLLELQKASTEIDTPLEQDFFSSIMEKNEELDSVDDAKELIQLLKSNDELIEIQINAVKNAFQTNKLESAKQNLLKLNYYVNLNNKIKEKQSNLNSTKDK